MKNKIIIEPVFVQDDRPLFYLFFIFQKAITFWDTFKLKSWNQESSLRPFVLLCVNSNLENNNY